MTKYEPVQVAQPSAVKTRKIPVPLTGREMGLSTKLEKPKGARRFCALASERVLEPSVASFLAEPEFLVYTPPIRSTNLRLMKCKRKFLLRVRLGLRRRGYYQSAFFAGRLYHHVLAGLMRKLKFAEVSEEARQLAFQQIVETREEAHPDTGLLPDGRAAEAIVDKIERDRDMAVAMAEVFHKRFEPIPAGMSPVTVEDQIYARVEGIPHIATARLDLLASEDPDPTCLWIVDSKTTSDEPSRVAAAMSFDLQPQHYRVVAMANFPDHSIVGVIHNIIKKPTIRYCPTTKDKSGFDSYIQRVFEWYTVRIRAAEAQAQAGHPDPEFPIRQSKVRFTPEVASDFMQLLREGSDNTKCRMSLDRFPRCSDNYECIGMGGSSCCEFLPLCRQTGTGNWDRMIGPPGSRRPFEQRDPKDPN